MSFRTPPPSPSSCDGKSRVDNSETNISLRLPESSVILQEGEPSEGDSAFLLGIREFTNSEIDVATAKYSKVVGQGGFGTVHQGIYHDLHIVVKQLNRVCCMISMSVCVCVCKLIFFEISIFLEDGLHSLGCDTDVLLRRELETLTRCSSSWCLCECQLYLVLILHRFRHPNLVPVMGYVKSPTSLVYPFMANLSPHHQLHLNKVWLIA